MEKNNFWGALGDVLLSSPTILNTLVSSILIVCGWYIVHKLSQSRDLEAHRFSKQRDLEAHRFSKQRDLEKDFRVEVRSKLDDIMEQIDSLKEKTKECFNTTPDSDDRRESLNELKISVEFMKFQFNLLEELVKKGDKKIPEELKTASSNFLREITISNQYDDLGSNPISLNDEKHKKIETEGLNFCKQLEFYYFNNYLNYFN